MKESIRKKCDLLAQNYGIVQNSAKLDFAQTAALGALIYTNKNALAKEADIRANRKLLHAKVSAFSNLAGHTALALLCKMSLSEDSEAYLDKVIAAYDNFKRGTFHSEYEALAASCMADIADPAAYEEIGREAIEILDKMAERHPMLTGPEDSTAAAMLAMTGLDADAVLSEAEECYQFIKNDGFTFSKDALQSVSLILALSPGAAEEKCQYFQKLRHALAKTGSKISGGQMPILAAFIDLGAAPEQIAADIDEACRYLKTQSGFGDWFGVGYRMRVTLASAVVFQAYREEEGVCSVADTANNAMASVITQQIVVDIIMTMIIIAVVVTAASSRT